MSEPKYSDFTLNFNPGARGNDKAPTLKGKAKVIDSDGTATEFEVAAWGPNTAQSGGPDFYNVTFTPKDPAHAARTLKTKLDGPVLQRHRGLRAQEARLGAPLRAHRRADRQGQGRRQEPAEILRPRARAAALGPALHRHVGLAPPGAQLLFRQRAAARSCRSCRRARREARGGAQISHSLD